MGIKYSLTGTPLLDTTNMEVVVTDDGYYRFVNHSDKILTAGFKQVRVLKTWSDEILATKGALDICRDRYKHNFGKKKEGK